MQRRIRQLSQLICQLICQLCRQTCQLCRQTCLVCDGLAQREQADSMHEHTNTPMEKTALLRAFLHTGGAQQAPMLMHAQALQ